MEYNSQREPMKIPEYGRNVQLLTNYIIKNITDREDRNRAVQTIIGIMSQQNPQMRNQPEYLQKIWDQLYFISEGKLDVDYPFPVPDLNTIRRPHSDKLNYSTNNLKYHFYGKNIELMIEKAIDMAEGETKTKYITTLINYMRLSYRTWNDDKVSDDIIIKHLTELSKGRIIMDKLPEAPKIDKPYSKDFRRFKGKNYSHPGPGRR